MALKGKFTFTDNFGVDVTFDDVNVVVEGVWASKHMSKAQVVFYNADHSKKIKDESINFPLIVEGGVNPLKQAYEHLKILPEFAGAVDC